MIKFVIRLVILLTVPVLASAQTVQLLGVRVGETVIHIPAPSEFYEIGQLSAKTNKYFSIIANSFESELLGIFVPKEDVSDMVKYNRFFKGHGSFAMLSVYRELKDIAISVADFQEYKEGWKSAPNPSNSEMQSGIQDVVSALNRAHQGSFDIAVGEVETTLLGFFVDDDNAIGDIALQKLEMERSDTGKRETVIMVISEVDMLVKDKLLTILVATPYKIHDIDWVRSTSKDWVRQILSYNE